MWCCAIIALTWCSAWSADIDPHPDDEDLKGQLGTLRNTIKVLSGKSTLQFIRHTIVERIVQINGRNGTCCSLHH